MRKWQPDPLYVDLAEHKDIWTKRASAVMFAAEHSWFVPHDLPIHALSRIAKYAETNDVVGVDILMKEHIQSHITELINYLISNYPERTHIFQEAFSLHEEGRFISAIPLFLSQAEGIGQSISNRSLFNIKSGNKTQISDYLDKAYTTQIISMFVAPLKMKHPLTQTGLKGVSRHKVMHGNDIHYGTQLNSLKAISFLGNVGWLLSTKH